MGIRLCIALIACAASAQAPSAWHDLVLPGGTAGAVIQATAQTIAVRDGAALHAFSPATANWQGVTLLGTAAHQQHHRMLAVREPGSVVAWSSWRGLFAARPVGSGAAIVGPARLDDDVLLVVDGNQLHAFSAFAGTWSTRSLPPNATVLARHATALLYTDQLASGFDPYREQWHDVGLQGTPSANQLNGHAILLEAAGELHAFSAHAGRWTTTTSPIASPVLASGWDFAVASGGDTAVAYSAVTRTLATLSVPVSSTQVQGGSVVMSTPGSAFAFSAATGFWSALPSQSQFYGASAELAVFTTPDPARPWVVFNAATGATSSHTQSIATLTNGLAAATQPAGPASVYSAFTGTWIPLPASTTGPTSTWFDLCGIVRPTGSKNMVNARTGRLTPAATASAAYQTAGSAGAFVLEIAGATLRVFDTRTDRWLAVPPGLGIRQVTTNVLLAANGTAAAGYSALTGRMSTTTLPEPLLSTIASQSVGAVRTANHVIGFAALPANSSPFGWPEMVPSCGLLTTYHHQLRLEPGSAALLGIGTRASAPTPIAPFGDLWLDTTAISTTLLASAAGELRRTLALPIPALAALRGSEWFVQSLVLPAVGTPFLTDPNQLRIR